jgi:DNA-binding transcriptional LysR family regulator
LCCGYEQLVRKIKLCLTMLPVDDIRFFPVLVKAGSPAAPAREINVTPPAMTQRLQQIEARLGVRLIDRSGIKYRSF